MRGNVSKSIVSNIVNMDIPESGFAAPIVCEASGEDITLNDSAELPLKALKVYGKTKQLSSTGKNLIPYSYSHSYHSGKTKTANGVTFTANDDGSVTVTGTASEKTVYLFCQDYSSSRKYPLEAGGYYLSFSTDIPNPGSVFMVEAYIKHSSGGFYIQTNYGKNYATVTEDMLEARIQVCQLVVYADASLPSEGVTVYPMFEKGSKASPYEPPTNGKLSPSPELPQPMNSAGKDGRVHIEVSNGDGSEGQTFSVAIPNELPLRGVPLSPVAADDAKPIEQCRNYVDSNGVSWICDEIDLEKGVYIQRIEEYTLELPTVEGNAESGFYCFIRTPFDLLYAHPSGYCNRGAFGPMFDITGSMLEFYYYPELYPSIDITTAEQVKELMDGAKMLLIRAEPIETPLTEKQINAYKELKLTMYKPNTTISNNDGAYLRAEYIADTKTYIDNKFAELQTAIISTGGNV